MSSLSRDGESGVESELIDLGSCSMRTLRKSNEPTFRQALQHVMQRAACPRMAAAGGTEDKPGQRVD